ncbi:polysaccharide biosynthesis protein [Vibrio parahaemolyticus]|uniref:Polysaccharide biosynthesis protein n=4 Tax=Vibrio harveyi group TaxID=717610 RepID=A0ABM9WU50_VIBAE|nr:MULTISPECIES: oligosaccharide flippase family protein [Vibrio harveyi group]ACY49934.1 O-antigen flippase Wzx [Vibrio antiquarius]EDN56853.1 polysaccharide biosynthesis protein [Vibrio antiquarius]EGQ8123716.1 oligosaccharide flippase family protein [Vibrio parahaemolyticus]EID0698069.1 oligosaccharide flippase family protein [Vibrio parahaemolyticus]ODY53036.1 polysaccharide biosynthesis protein [Vibrio parahaemolyticus]
MTKDIFHRLLNHKMIRNVLILMSGSAGSQVIGILFIPIITRFYGPEAYGILGVFIACLGVLIPLSTFGFPGAIVLPKDERKAINLARLSILTSLIVFLFSFVIIFCFGEYVFNQISDGKLIDFMYLIPIGMLMGGWLDVSHQLLIRKGDFKTIASISILHSFLNYGGQALLGFLNPITKFLLVIHVASSAIRVITLNKLGMFGFFSFGFIKLPNDFKEIIYEYREFPCYRAPQMIINALSQSVPVILFASLFSPVSAGYYALTRTILNVPIRLLGNSLQNVFYPNFNDLVVNLKCCSNLLLKTMFILFLLGLVPSLIIFIYGPDIFSIAFGEKWRTSGSYAQWLTLWLYLVLITRPVVAAIPVLGLQRWYLVFEVVSIIVRCLVFIFSASFELDELSVVAIFSLSEVILHIILAVKVYMSSVSHDVKINQMKLIG